MSQLLFLLAGFAYPKISSVLTTPKSACSDRRLRSLATLPAFLRFERLFEPFVDLLSDGQREGSVRNDHPANFLSQMIVGMLNSAITSWLANPDYPVEEGLHAANDFAIETLRPR